MDVDEEPPMKKLRVSLEVFQDTKRHKKRGDEDRDQWFKWENGEVAFSVFYIHCAGGAAWLCNAVSESQLWDRLKDQPEASGQRWYCTCCEARYRTKFGVVVETVMKGESAYFHAELPHFYLRCNVQV